MRITCSVRRLYMDMVIPWRRNYLEMRCFIYGKVLSIMHTYIFEWWYPFGDSSIVVFENRWHRLDDFMPLILHIIVLLACGRIYNIDWKNLKLVLFLVPAETAGACLTVNHPQNRLTYESHVLCMGADNRLTVNRISTRFAESLWSTHRNWKLGFRVKID